MSSPSKDRKFVCKNLRKKWDKQDMEQAIECVKQGRMGLKTASKTFRVPRTTLQRMVKKVKTDDLPISDTVDTRLGRKTVFGNTVEKEIVNYILQMESQFYGLTRNDLCKMAYTVAMRNGIAHPFTKNSAGRSWLDAFLRRHKNLLSERRPTGTSFARALGFNKENTDAFFDILDSIYEKHKFEPHRIFNVDETGLSVVPSRIPKVIARKGKRQIASITSAERGSLVTLVVSMSAGGQFVPPMLIFPRKNRNDQLIRGALPGTIYAVHPTGWIQLNLFTEWFNHFIRFVKPTEDSPVLLILDGHYSHTRNLDVINLARQNHVHIVSLPPHSTHRLQPLDKTFMGPLKAYYSEGIRNWLRTNNRGLTQFDLTEILSNALLKCQTAEIASNGFRVTGIWSLDRHIFSDADFIAETIASKKTCSTSDPLPVSPQMSEGQQKDSGRHTPVCDLPTFSTVNFYSKPGCSKDADSDPNNSENQEIQKTRELGECSQAFISPFDIAPVPPVKKRASTRGRKASKSKIITSSPYKTDLELSLEKTNKLKETKHKKKYFLESVRTIKGKLRQYIKLKITNPVQKTTDHLCLQTMILTMDKLENMLLKMLLNVYSAMEIFLKITEENSGYSASCASCGLMNCVLELKKKLIYVIFVNSF